MMTSKHYLSTALLSSVFQLVLLAGCATTPATRPISGSPTPFRPSPLFGSLTTVVPQPVARINFGPSTLIAHDLQDIVGEDKIILYYTAQVFSSEGESRIQWLPWRHDEVKKGSEFSSGFKRMDLEIPPNGRVVFSARLEEVDDSAATEKLINILADSVSLVTNGITMACGWSKKVNDKACAISEIIKKIAGSTGEASGLIGGLVSGKNNLGEECIRKLTYAELKSAGPVIPLKPCEFKKDGLMGGYGGYDYEVRFNVRVTQPDGYPWLRPR